MFKLASLFVDISARDQTKETLVQVQQDLNGWGAATATAVGTLAAGAIASATSSIASFFATGIQGAVDLQETLSKVNAIFGDSAGIITSQADAMAQKFGVVKSEYLNAASSFGASFKAAGLSGDAAAEVGNKLAKLGMDMASFGNASNEEVFTALNAALRGEFDPLERFNVMLNANAVSEAAVAQGLAKNKNEVDELAKKQATLNLIMAKTTDQQGDLERTADGSANQYRRLTGTLTNMAVELGGKLEPALNAVLLAGNGLVDSLGPGIEWLGGVFDSFAAGVQEVVDVVGVAWRNLDLMWEITTIKASEMGMNLVAILETLPENVGRIAAWIGRNWYQLIVDGLTATGTAFMNFGENLSNLAAAVYRFVTDPTAGFEFQWTPLLKGFEATAEALPELVKPALVDLQDEIDRAGNEMADRETKRAEDIAAKRAKAAKPVAGQAAAADAGGGSDKSQRFDSADFAYKLQLDLLNGKDDTAKKQLAAQEKIEKNTGKIAEAAERPRAAVFA